MATRDDKPMAGLLRRGLSRTEASAGACPGPDLLAAYYERSLDPAEKAHWEVHFASCQHCRAQLAALARSEAPEELATRPAWFLNWRWLAPAAAALAVVLVWVVVRSSPDLLRRRPTQLQQTAANLPSKTIQLGENTVSAPSEAERKEEERPSLNASPAPPRVPAGRAAKKNAPHEAAQDATQAERAKSENESENNPAVAGEQATAAPAARSRVLAVPSTSAAPAAPPAPDEAVPSASAGQADKSARRPRFSATVREGAAQNAPLIVQTVESRSNEVFIRTPDPAVIWRVGPAGLIERSEDGGKTWQGQFVKTNADLVAGSAPSTKVCWVVGRAGTILRTTDGERWERVASPAAVDLVGVQARDAQSASVRAADGRTFVTEDGGQTWQLKP